MEHKIQLRLDIYNDGGAEWVAFVIENPELEYISGVGSTAEKAYRKLEEALKLYYAYIKEKVE